jgi:hypothetical protein
MQRTAHFHDHIADARLPQAAGVVDHAAALDTAVDRLDTHAATRDASIRGFLRAREGAASRLPAQHHQEDMKPLMGCALAHPEPPPLHHLEGIRLQVDQEKQQPIFRGR